MVLFVYGSMSKIADKITKQHALEWLGRCASDSEHEEKMAYELAIDIVKRIDIAEPMINVVKSHGGGFQITEKEYKEVCEKAWQYDQLCK